MDEYKTFLAERVLTEDRVVTYRLLSRNMNVHANTAKRMLFDFHQSQNAMKLGSVHATYLVTGSLLSDEPSQPEVEAVVDSSSPASQESSEDTQILNVCLIPEGKLQAALSRFATVASIHVYSLGSHPIADLRLIPPTDELGQWSASTTDDSSRGSEVIVNRNISRRQPGNQTADALSTSQQSSGRTKSSTPKSFAMAKAVCKEAEAPEPTLTSSGPKAVPAAVPPLKRGGSGILDSFAKMASKPRNVQPPPAPVYDSEGSPKFASDDGEDDGEDDAVDLFKPAPMNDLESNRKTRREREAELRRMMDVEDEEEESVAKGESSVASPHEGASNEEVVEAEQETSSAPDKAGPKRGKRRVTRKKQVQDAEGYLVTIQEDVWESFSEEEIAESTPKPTGSKPTASQSSKTKKAPAPAKTGQGNITSFFSKK